MTYDVRVDQRSNCTGQEVADWLAANAKGDVQAALMVTTEKDGLQNLDVDWHDPKWLDHLGSVHESNNAYMRYRFSDTSDALRFKLTFGVANVAA